MGQLLWLLRAKYLVDAIGLNKIPGRPFKQIELKKKIKERLGDEVTCPRQRCRLSRRSRRRTFRPTRKFAGVRAAVTTRFFRLCSRCSRSWESSARTSW